MVVVTGFVKCGCFGNMCTCIYCVLYFLYCVFCIVSFMYIYSYLFCLYWCKDYCHRLTTQLQLLLLLLLLVVVVVVVIVIVVTLMCSLLNFLPSSQKSYKWPIIKIYQLCIVDEWNSFRAASVHLFRYTILVSTRSIFFLKCYTEGHCFIWQISFVTCRRVSSFGLAGNVNTINEPRESGDRYEIMYCPWQLHCL